MKTILWIVLAAASIPVMARAASLTEPATVFYGKVINQNGPVEHLLTEGELVWAISGPSGEVELSLGAPLASYSGGEFSYRLDVPHHVLALGLEPTADSLAVAADDVTHQHLEIRVGDQIAAIKSPGTYRFDISTALRAATHRLDLIVSLPEDDSDGDGMPDWWEDAQGLDKQVNDADGDLDGDGLTNLEEYRAGSGAGHDNRGPELLTSELFAYSAAKTGVMLQTLDLDSEPEQITFTLTAPPAAGSLLLRNAEEDPLEPDLELGQGDTFTQADVNGGRLIFHIEDAAADPPETSFAVALRDEVPGRDAATGVVQVDIFVPAEGTLDEVLVAAATGADPLPGVNPAEEALLRSAALGRGHGFVVWDFSGSPRDHSVAQPSTELSPGDYEQQYAPKFGAELRHVLVGGSGDDALSGGIESDIIFGGAGDDQLRGAGSADLFVIRDGGDGNDTLADFALGEGGDVLDISRVLDGSSISLTDYVEIRDAELGAQLGIDVDGDGSGFSDIVVTFAGHSLMPADLYRLVADGNLRVGEPRLQPRVEIAASAPVASENGPLAGGFTVTRAGSTDIAVQVSLNIAGSATNGGDYSYISSTLTIPAGEQAVHLPVAPFRDNQVELDEVVEITLLSGTGYGVGTSSSAQVVIEDLKPEISATALVPRAESSSGQAGMFMISRVGGSSESLLVQFTVGGTASAASDYNPLLPFVELAAGQSFGLVEVAPRASANFSAAAKTVTLALLDDPSYLIVEPEDARVVIVEETTDLGEWRERHFAGNEQELEEFATADSGGSGLAHLLRYGFDLAPTDPLHARAEVLPGVSMVENHLTLRYRENPAARDLDYRVEVTADLHHWRIAGPADIEEVTQLPAAAGVKVYRSLQAADSAAFRLMRVRVVRTNP